MKYLSNLLVVLLAIVLLQSCDPGDEVDVVNVEQRYSIEIPSFLTETTVLNDDASLQYMDQWREFYVIVIDESKEEMHEMLETNGLLGEYPPNVEGYAGLLMDGFLSSLENMEVSDSSRTNINGLDAKLLSVFGTVDDIDIFYRIGYFEGASRYYQVLVWTLPSKEDKFRDKMEGIIRSLKELEL